MNQSFKGKSLTLLSDFLTINLAWGTQYYLRVKSGWFASPMAMELWMPMFVICVYWFLIFFFYGLYRSWYAKSRFDEFSTVFKAATFGVLLLFFAIFIDDSGRGSPMHSRLLIMMYWALLVCFVGSGRFLQHTFHRRLLEAGVGLKKALIIGWTDRSRFLYDSVTQYPALGYDVVGFLSMDKNNGSYKNIPVLGSLNEITQILHQYKIEDIIIAMDSTEHDKLLDVIARCNSHPVSIKIVPDLYDIISGQARTNQIYGFPLIEIMPNLLTPWERFVKRSIDIAVAATVLTLGLPIWLIIAIAIKLDSHGPVFYVQDRVGKDGKNFKMIKFRSMDDDAEKYSGPVWAEKKDKRITRMGKILRKARLDEFPQLINVLDGDMSLVGPRPERGYFVEQLSKEIPLYARRLKVRPGITGWAQVKHKYDESIDDVRKKVEYDLFYIENISLRMDFKILLNTILVMLSGRGH
ncbi:MAG: sugar transferase [Bacteroidota bacterium]